MAPLLPTNRREIRVIRGTENGVRMPDSVYQSYTWEWLDLNIMVQANNGMWIYIKSTGVDLNNNAPAPTSLAGPEFDAQCMAEIFNKPARIMDTRDGQMILEISVPANRGAWKISNIKHDDGDCGHYSGEVKGYGRVSGVKSCFIWIKGKTTGYICNSYIQRQIEWDKEYTARYQVSNAIRRELRKDVRDLEIIGTDPFEVAGQQLRYNDSTFDPYLSRWQWFYGGEWDYLGVPICELLDELCHMTPHTYEEWCAIGKQRWDDVNGVDR